MTTTSNSAIGRSRYHRDAFQFVFAALQEVQRSLDRFPSEEDESESHISGEELLHGIRRLAVKQFGLLTNTVFQYWGIRSTADFGHIVFELIDRGEMRKTDRDQLSDFFDVYDFNSVFDRDYVIDTNRVFRH